MAEPDPDIRRAQLLIAVIVVALVLLALLTWLYGLSALYIAGAIATPLFLVAIIQLALESADPEHANLPHTDDNDEAI